VPYAVCLLCPLAGLVCPAVTPVRCRPGRAFCGRLEVAAAVRRATSNVRLRKAQSGAITSSSVIWSH
jgi:hypothetical protein